VAVAVAEVGEAEADGGEELVTSATPGKGLSGIVQVGKVNSNEATAWQNGQLIFENEQLSSVAERVGRYAAHPVVAEGAAGQLRISGVFNAGDVATFVDTIQRGFPVEAEERDDGGVVLKPKS
jgi:transmembrane sensor